MTTIVPVAGSIGYGNATDIAQTPNAVAIHGTRMLYVSDGLWCVVRRIDRAVGQELVVAGSGIIGFGGDGGTGTSAKLSSPNAVAVDTAQNLYIVDYDNERIRKLDTNGLITTFAGNGRPGYSGDGGPAAMASLRTPNGVAVDLAGRVYIADTDNERIRRVDVDGTITTVAGTGVRGFSGDGAAATSAELHAPSGVAVDDSGVLYIADTNNNRIRSVGPDGIIHTIAGNGVSGYSGDGGPAVEASISTPYGVGPGPDGSVLIAEFGNNVVRQVLTDGIITTLAGSATAGFGGDGGDPKIASLNGPTDVHVDSLGNIFITDFGNQRVRVIDSQTGLISTVSGNGQSACSGDSGPAVRAQLMYPAGLANEADVIYIADAGDCRVRRVGHDGTITTLAGTGVNGYAGDHGLATAALLSAPSDIAVSADGRAFIADSGNARIRVVDRTGVITTFAGTGEVGYGGDNGPATAARFQRPVNVALDSSGSVLVADCKDHRIRIIDSTGTITTLAGDGTPGFGGDGGPATQAQLQSPCSVVVGSDSNIYIADSDNRRIRMVDRHGIITTVAGNGASGHPGEGVQATDAALRRPTGVGIDHSTGTLYIADGGNRRLYAVRPDGVIRAMTGQNEQIVVDGQLKQEGPIGISPDPTVPCGIISAQPGAVMLAITVGHLVCSVTDERERR